MADNIFVDARKGSLTSTKLEAYLASGVDINAQDPKTGFTPLGMAAKYGRLSVVNLLLDKNASPRAMSKPGMTPLYIAANGNGDRVNIVRKLLEKGAQVDETSAEVDNDTPLMVAITHARDPVVVNMLIDAGASLQAKNSKNETAKELAEQSGNPAIQRAVSPPGQQMAGLPELINALVNFVLFILAYVNSGVINGVVKGVVSNLYHIGQPPPDQTLAQDLDNPTTIDDFQKGVEKYVQDSDLGQFFAPGNDYLQKVAEKAIELKDDPRNHLKEPEQMKGLVKLALYQPIFYCDDSGSMQANILDPNGNVVSTRMEAMRSLVQRMSSIATRLVPDGSGAHLRFINSDYQGDDLTADQIDSHMQFQPMGGTNIGTNLKKKVLEPLVFKKLDKDGKLDRPFLVLTITDGEPSPEPVDTFKKTIEECGRRLDQKDYPQESTMFLISQVGNDPHADKFLDSLSGDTAIDRVLFRSSERLHEKYAELRDNEGELEEWVTSLLFPTPAHKTYMSPMIAVVDLVHDTAAIPGKGDTLVTFAHTFDLAKYADRVLDFTEWEREYWIIGDKATWNEVLQAAEEGKDTKFKVTHDSIEDLEKGVVKELPTLTLALPHIPIPRDAMLAFSAAFSLVFETGGTNFDDSVALNNRFPDIKPLRIKDAIRAAAKAIKN
ncbi:hypothetical protein NW765_001715 [Fusarium oxysporum]|nr:hypothetical protein NW765_001715 [Fusarium oxysporum]